MNDVKEETFMKPRKFRALILLSFGVFLFLGTHISTAAEKKVVFPSVYSAKANPHPKISSGLQEAMKFAKTASKTQKEQYFKSISPSNPHHFRLDNQNRIQCYLQCTDLTKDTLKKLEQYGVKIQHTDGMRKFVQTWLSGDQIDLIESLPEVKFVRTPSYPVINVGSVTTEGYGAMKIDEFVNRPEFIGANITGRDIKVGVISSAISRSTDSSLFGDLPIEEAPGIQDDGKMGGITYFSFRTDGVGDTYGLRDEGIMNYWTGFPHEEGTAMLEIVHDIVPDARLYFSNFDTDLEMNMSKDWLRDQGCDVIIDDIGFFNNGPADGTSVVSMGSTRQVENGAAYYTSVGNDAEVHWWGYFYDPEKNNINNFGVIDETLEILVPPGSGVSVFLTWDEPWGSYPPYEEGSGYDIDLYLLDPNFLDFNMPLGYSTDTQLGDGDPAEWAWVSNYSYDYQVLSVVITRKIKLQPYDDVNHPMRMNMFIMGGYINEKDYMVREGSITNNNDAGGGVVSVAAIDVSSRSHSVVEYFSSRGPTWDGRQKPEITSFDGTSGGKALWGTNFETFFGTSCASPHAGAVAALIKGYKVSLGDPDFINPWNPKQVVDNINSAIFQGAEDMLPTGVDNMSGYGRIDCSNIFIKNFLSTTGRRKIYIFNEDEEGWRFTSAPGYFTEADYYHENGRLVLQSKDNNTFSSWEGPVVVFSDDSFNLNPAKLYMARFKIATTSVPDKYPAFRIRANAPNATVSHVRDYNSKNGSDHYPGAFPGMDYYLVFRPTQTEAMSGIYLSFDIINFNAGDDPTGALYLDEVEIIEYGLPE